MRGIGMTDCCVRALLNTRPDVWPAEPIDRAMPFKWQTRRIIKPQPTPNYDDQWCWQDGIYMPSELKPTLRDWHLEQTDCLGEVCYVKEAIMSDDQTEPYPYVRYKADAKVAEWSWATSDGTSCVPMRWRWKRSVLPSVFMPREVARLWVRIMGVGAERVRDITPDDVQAEGLSLTGKFVFSEVWNALHAKGGHTWESNPWVWRYEIQRVSEPK